MIRMTLCAACTIADMKMRSMDSCCCTVEIGAGAPVAFDEGRRKLCFEEY
jgi:hypothetical protein